jgi:hypothetical protein
MWPLNDPQIVPVGSGLWVQSPPLLCRAIDRPPQTAYRQGARERDEVILAPEITGYRALLEWLTVFKLHQPRLNSGFGAVGFRMGGRSWACGVAWSRCARSLAILSQAFHPWPRSVSRP